MTHPTVGRDSVEKDKPPSPDCGIGPSPRKDEPTLIKKRPDPDELIEVRILAEDGYRTQIPMPNAPLKFEDHTFPAGAVAMLPRYKAEKLIMESKAELVTAGASVRASA